MLIAKSSFEDVVWRRLIGIWKRRGCLKKWSQVFPSVLYRYNTILLWVHGDKGSKEKEIQMPWILQSNLWLEVCVCVAACHIVVNPNHWISMCIKQQPLWQHIFYTPLCPETLQFSICMTLYCLFIIYPGRNADGLASHPNQKLA